MADYPKLLLAGALILVAAGSASAQQGRAAGDKDSMLAFVSERDGNSEIYVMDADGSFDFVYDVYVMNADGSNITPLFAGPFFSRDGQIFYFQPSWSPDGRKMAVVVCGYAWDICHPSSSIAITNDDGLTTLVQAGGYARPAWSPDGSTIAFSTRACRDCPGSLRYVSTDGTRSGLIFSNGHSPAWRP